MKPSAVFIPPLPRLPCRHCDGGDRFIPNRSAMDLDYAQYQLTQSRKVTERIAARPSSLSKEAYRKLLVDAVFNNRTRILSFNSKPPTPTHNLSSDSTPNRPVKQKRYISKSPESELDAPDIVDDYFLNLLDWGSSNVLSIALGNSLYLWTSDSTWELLTVQDYIGPITSVSWAPDGQHIAVGLNNSHIQLWDSTNKKLLRTLSGVHISRVGSLSWNNQNILTTGGRDGKIVNNDVRIRSHILQTYRGHNKEVCGLKWSASGQRLASGGNDNLLHIWDISMASSTPAARNQNRWVHRFEDHNAPVKALAWCPFQKNLLASGGGHNDRCIMFWDTNTGACLDSIDTGSQVCSLLWNNKERELLSTQGKQLTLWKYPSMVQIAELTGHDSRVLFMAQSPDGCTVASAGGDERVMIWNVFGNPQVTKRAPQASPGPFSSYNHTKIR